MARVPRKGYDVSDVFDPGGKENEPLEAEPKSAMRDGAEFSKIKVPLDGKRGGLRKRMRECGMELLRRGECANFHTYIGKYPHRVPFP